MNKVFIIAEIGVNHNGDLGLAKKLVQVAHEAGADAVKFQTFKAENLVARSAPKADYQLKTTAQDESQLQMLKRLELSYENHFTLKKFAEDLDLEFLSSPFDMEALDFLSRDLGVKKIKIPSGEAVNAPYLYRIGQTGIEAILSTGMCDISDVENALAALGCGYLKKKIDRHVDSYQMLLKEKEFLSVLKEKVSLLHCVTDYPCPLEDANIRVIKQYIERFPIRIGYSDHTVGVEASLAAVALGSVVLEKHITLDKNMTGPDHKASLSPEEFKIYVRQVRAVEKSLGSGQKIPTHHEIKNRVPARKSLVALENIQQGQVFSEKNLGMKRPGDGISPFHYWEILGQKAKRDYSVDELIDKEQIDAGE